MIGKKLLGGMSASKFMAMTYGVLCGLGGMRHGIGEIQQGNAVPEGVLIDSWVTGPLAEHMGGEPALTIIPNVLATGILAIIISLAIIVWSLKYLHRRRNGLILLLLSVALFLFGGGFGPPFVGILAGIAGLGIDWSFPIWRKILVPGIRPILAALWPWVFGICLAAGILLFILSLITIFVFKHYDGNFYFNVFLVIFWSLIVSVILVIPYDLENAGSETME